MKQRAAKAVADLDRGVIIATVDIHTSPERVFRALTHPTEVVQWWGSAETYRTTEWSADVRVGGQWRGAGQGADGTAFHVGGEFLEVTPPRTLVQTWKASWDEGAPPTTLTYRIEPIATGSRLTVRHEGFAGRPDSCQGHADGWERVFTWLEGYLCPKASRQHYLVRLRPPRPDFAQTMTDAERAVMREHVAYWTAQVSSGTAMVFGPVADPSGGWGVGILSVQDADALAAVQRGDPAIQARLGFSYEALPMPRVVLG